MTGKDNLLMLEHKQIGLYKPNNILFNKIIIKTIVFRLRVLSFC